MFAPAYEPTVQTTNGLLIQCQNHENLVVQQKVMFKFHNARGIDVKNINLQIKKNIKKHVFTLS